MMVSWSLERIHLSQLENVYEASMNSDVFIHMSELSEHKALCQKLLTYFSEQKEVVGAFISGSGVSGDMDYHSDLDLGFVCKDDNAKEEIWKKRFEWPLQDWFHRMDADHVKPYFIIYLFNPYIHVDLAFYTTENLPPQAGGPYSIAFDKTKQLSSWISRANEPYFENPDWTNVVHEEERFWTWTHYSWCHVGRGEYYDIAADFGMLRNILHKWHSRLNGNENFNSRRLEHRGEQEFIEQMTPCFPKPNKVEMKSALLNLIKIHNIQRAQVENLVQPEWTTTQIARERITQLVREL